MSILLGLISLVIFCVDAFAINVFYDKNTSEIVLIGNVDVAAKVAENPNLNVGFTDDYNPLLKQPINYLIWDQVNSVITQKSSNQITNLISIKTNSDIANKIRLLRKQIETANADISDGITPDNDPTILSQQISNLKLQYQTEKLKQVK